MPGHLILLGDSIFDNAFYVPGGPSVIEQVNRTLPRDWRGTLLAIDGARVASVFDQLGRIPAEATHLALSVGGNDALWAAGSVFGRPAADVRDALDALADVAEEFAREYRRLVDELRPFRLPLILCTVYDHVPGLRPAERAGLCVFNDVISRTAFATNATLVDLRLICNDASDYAAVSPIEPSVAGGGKIARALVDAAVGNAGPRVIV